MSLVSGALSTAPLKAPLGGDVGVGIAKALYSDTCIPGTHETSTCNTRRVSDVWLVRAHPLIGREWLRLAGRFHSQSISFNPILFPGTHETTTCNTRRVSDVWLDGFKPLYELTLTQEERGYDCGDVTKRKEKRKELGCKSFNWYLENIYPELQVQFGY